MPKAGEDGEQQFRVLAVLMYSVKKFTCVAKFQKVILGLRCLKTKSLWLKRVSIRLLVSSCV